MSTRDKLKNISVPVELFPELSPLYRKWNHFIVWLNSVKQSVCRRIKMEVFKGYNVTDVLTIRAPKIVARVKLCGGALTFNFDDTMQFEMPTEEQRENLKKMFGIEVELVNED